MCPYRPREARRNPPAHRDDGLAGHPVEEIVAGSRPAFQAAQHRRGGPVGACARQVRGHPAVQASEGPELAFGKLPQPALATLPQKFAESRPLPSLLPHQGGRLQSPHPARRRPARLFLVVQPHQELVGRHRREERVSLDGRPDRLQHGTGHRAPRLPGEVVAAAAIVAQQLELLGREEGTARGRGAGRFRPGDFAGAVVAHHDGVRSQITQSLRAPGEHHHPATEHAGHRRLEVDNAQHVADHRTPHRDGLAARVQHPQPEDLLPRRLTVAQQLEQKKIPPLQRKEADHQHARGETVDQGHRPIPQQRVGHSQHDQAAKNDRHVDQQRRQTRAHVGQLVVEADVLGCFQPDPAAG